MTHEEMIEKTLDMFMKDKGVHTDIKLIAGRMRTDREFLLNVLSFYTMLCYYNPFVYQQLTEQMMKFMVEDLKKWKNL